MCSIHHSKTNEKLKILIFQKFFPEPLKIVAVMNTAIFCDFRTASKINFFDWIPSVASPQTIHLKLPGKMELYRSAKCPRGSFHTHKMNEYILPWTLPLLSAPKNVQRDGIMPILSFASSTQKRGSDAESSDMGFTSIRTKIYPHNCSAEVFSTVSLSALRLCGFPLK